MFLLLWLVKEKQVYTYTDGTYGITVQKTINLHIVHTYSLTSYLSIHNKLFSLIQNIEFLGYISWYLWDKFELFCHLRLWFITGKNCCILGGYALMRRIKSSRTVTMSCLRLLNSVLFCRFPPIDLWRFWLSCLGNQIQ